MDDLERQMAEFLAKGGKITKCPPGPSEHVVYKNGYRRRPKAETPAEPAPPAAAAEQPAEEAKPGEG